MSNHSFKLGDKVRFPNIKKHLIVAGFYDNGTYTNKESDFISCIYSFEQSVAQITVHYSLLKIHSDSDSDSGITRLTNPSDKH
jgi:hypothetical protein